MFNISQNRAICASDVWQVPITHTDTLYTYYISRMKSENTSKIDDKMTWSCYSIPITAFLKLDMFQCETKMTTANYIIDKADTNMWSN
jgi:hypothetical protein